MKAPPATHFTVELGVRRIENIDSVHERLVKIVKILAIINVTNVIARTCPQIQNHVVLWVMYRL